LAIIVVANFKFNSKIIPLHALSNVLNCDILEVEHKYMICAVI